MEQILSARQTITAALHLGSENSVRGHMWLWMIFCSTGESVYSRMAFFRATDG